MALLGNPMTPQQQQMYSLLGIDPAQMRKQALFNGLAAAGFTMMGNKDLSKAGNAFLLGTNQGQRDQMENATDMYKLQLASEDQAWNQKERARTQAQWDAQDQFAQNPSEDAFRKAYPQAYATQYGQTLFPETLSPSDRYKSVGGAIYDVVTGKWITNPNGGGGNGVTLGIDPDTGQLTLMAGGGGKGGGSGSLPAEMGSRLGMGEQFLQTDVPQIEPGIQAGDATGPIDYAQGVLGRGNAGVIHRRMASGVDALRRNLTGAGMSASEADDYVRRYLPSWTDDANTLDGKLKSLVTDLEAVKKGALAGKTGNLAAFLPGSKMFGPTQTPAAPAAPNAPQAQPKTGDVIDDAAAIPEGAMVVDESGQAYRKVNGQLVKVQ